VSVFFIWLAAAGQSSFKLIKTESIMKSQQKMHSAYLDGTGNYTRVFELPYKKKMLTSGAFKGQEYAEVTYGLVLPGGREILLEANEWFVAVKGNKLLTSKYHLDDEDTEIRTYAINREGLALIASRTIPSQSSFEMLEDQTVVISDLYELSGQYVDISSPSLSDKSTYKPFESAMLDMFFTYNTSGKIIGVFKDRPETQIKVAIFDSRTKSLLKEFILNSNLPIGSVKSFESHVLIYGTDQLLCVDFNGNKLWQRSIIIPNHDFFGDGSGNIYLFSRDKLISIALANGETNWEKTFAELGSSGAASKTINRPVSIKVSEDWIDMIVSETPEVVTLSSREKFNNYFIRFRTDGQVVERIRLAQSANQLAIIKATEDAIKIIQDEHILTYER
jgi:hypothetical protein